MTSQSATSTCVKNSETSLNLTPALESASFPYFSRKSIFPPVKFEERLEAFSSHEVYDNLLLQGVIVADLLALEIDLLTSPTGIDLFHDIQRERAGSDIDASPHLRRVSGQDCGYLDRTYCFKFLIGSLHPKS